MSDDEDGDWMGGYDVGYSEGESSAHADWIMALSEEFDMEGLEGPQNFIQRMKGIEGKKWCSK